MQPQEEIVITSNISTQIIIITIVLTNIIVTD